MSATGLFSNSSRGHGTRRIIKHQRILKQTLIQWTNFSGLFCYTYSLIILLKDGVTLESVKRLVYEGMKQIPEHAVKLHPARDLSINWT